MSTIYHTLINTVATAFNTPSHSSVSIPICDEAKDQFNCNTDWLSRIFGFPVSDFSIKPVGGGMTTLTYRLNITAKQESKSMFAKYLVYEDEPFIARLFKFIKGINLEEICKKEVFFYNECYPVFKTHGIRTPQAYYAVLEETNRPEILNVLGFKSPLRGVILMEDLGNCQNYPLCTTIPEKYAFSLSTKLAQFHTLNWYQPIHPEFPFECKPAAYICFFNLESSLFSRYPSKDKVIDIINNWEQIFTILTEPKVKDALISFSENGSKLDKYYTNDIPPSQELFQHHTLLHGDFHSGNIFFLTEPSQEDPEIQDIKDIALVDFQCYGYGHPSTEFSYFLLNCVDFDPERDVMLMKVYYDELTKTIPPEEYPWEVFQREVEIRCLQFVITDFNNHKMTPEMMNKLMDLFVKKGLDMEKMLKSGTQKYLRFAHIIEKWNQENTWERI